MRTLMAYIIFSLLFFMGSSAAMAMNHAVMVRDNEGLGKYLTDNEGMTLYWFKKDTPGTSACAGPCIEKWPVYYRESIKSPEGVKAEDFGTITRSDGKKQTTFRGYPLYYWANDQKAGDTSGQGVNNVWHVVDPGNFPPK